MWIDLKYLEPSISRGFLGCISLILMISGAWLVWDWKVAIFTSGIALYIECSSDEIVERITLIKRKAK